MPRYLNLGCGKVIMPQPKPEHHALVSERLYDLTYEWDNVDKVDLPGVDVVCDLFTYPWPLDSDAYDGALLSHIVEHIPHEIRVNEHSTGRTKAEERALQTLIPGISKDDPLHPDYLYHTLSDPRAAQLSRMQDGWYAFFSELYRVLKPGAVAHILAPYAWSQGAVTDPTHTRLVTEHTFTHSLAPENRGHTFQYEVDCHFEMVGAPSYMLTQLFHHLNDKPDELQLAFQTRINVAYEIYVQLKAVKDA